MTIKSKVLVFIISVIIGFTAKAQDPHFSQFYANPLYLNPAFAGAKICPRFIMNYRNQWPAIPGSYVTYNASFDMHIRAIGGGLGILAMSDKSGEGVLTNTSAAIIYSVLIPVSKTFSIKAGLQAGYFQKTLDFNRLTFGDQIDSRWGFIYNTATPAPSGNMYKTSDVDFSAGILGYSKIVYVGFSAQHLVPVNESFLEGNSILYTKFSGHAGMNISLTGKGLKKLKPSDPQLSPNIVFIQQGPFHQFNYGLYYKNQPMIFGLWYRHFLEGSDAMVVMAGFEYDKFKLGYSYDITISKLAPVSGGAHEISFALDFNCPQKKHKYRAIVCPSF